jgi:hypothetical protein
MLKQLSSGAGVQTDLKKLSERGADLQRPFTYHDAVNQQSVVRRCRAARTKEAFGQKCIYVRHLISHYGWKIPPLRGPKGRREYINMRTGVQFALPAFQVDRTARKHDNCHDRNHAHDRCIPNRPVDLATEVRESGIDSEQLCVTLLRSNRILIFDKTNKL